MYTRLSTNMAMELYTFECENYMFKTGPGSTYKWGERTPRSRVITPPLVTGDGATGPSLLKFSNGPLLMFGFWMPTGCALSGANSPLLGLVCTDLEGSVDQV